MKGIAYTQIGDYLLPNLLPPQEQEVHLGKYALMRRSFLEKSRRIMYTNLLTSGRLNAHLMQIEQTVKQMAENLGVTEALKATDQMKWVGMMNNIRQAAEQSILKELIYS